MNMDLGSVPQWITAAIAAGALFAAYLSIQSQREIARKRAAMDFFAKTEMDKNTLDQHKQFKEAIEKLKEYSGKSRKIEEFVESEKDEYWAIRDYLNLHELVGVGINQEVFDDNVCYDFWSGEMRRARRDTKELVDYIQSLPDEKDTYCEFVEVAMRWHGRDEVKGRAIG